MKTDKISVSSQGARMNAALEQADKVAAYKGLSMKDALHLRLLTEEMMGLMRSITGEREGIFWIEDEDGEYRLHLQVRTLLNSEEREQLLFQFPCQGRGKCLRILSTGNSDVVHNGCPLSRSDHLRNR